MHDLGNESASHDSGAKGPRQSSSYARTLRLALAILVPLAACQGIDSAVPLGAFESNGDLGMTPKAGSMQFDPATGEYTIVGGGSNIWGTTDAFHFAWKKTSGNIRLAADVKFVGDGGDPHRKAVLMIRQDLSPSAAYADIAFHGNGLLAMQYREVSGGETHEIRLPAQGPSRLAIERRGNEFVASVEPLTDGEPISTPAQTIQFSDSFYAGIGVSAHNEEGLQTAMFSNVVLAPPPPTSQKATIVSPTPTSPTTPPKPRSYRSKIAIFDLVSRESVVVFQADQLIEAPNWSRDGKTLVVNTEGQLYRIPTAPQGQEKLEALGLAPEYRCNNDHDFSQDGQWLAFSASSPSSERSQVFVARADGSNVKLLTPTAPSYFHGWSPDGQWLAFVAERGNGRYELYRVPAQGGPEERLTTKGGYDDGPDYSPDGKWLYFNSNRSGRWELWRMPPDGAGPNDEKAQQITNDGPEDWFPHVSPDGKWIVFLAFPEGTKGHDDRIEGMSLRLIEAPGDELTTLPQVEHLTTFFGGQGTINVNSWSPDSKRFAYVIYEPLP